MDDIARFKQALPADLRRRIADRTWTENTIGCSDVRVFHVSGRGYLKIAPVGSPSAAPDLRGEFNRLAWLHAQALPVPQPLYYAIDNGTQFMLMGEIRGLPSFDDQFRLHHPRQVIHGLAEGLRRLHSLDITRCPFDSRLDVLIPAAQANVAAGRIDPAHVDPVYQGRSADDMLDEILTTRPQGEDLVFAHGDYCMPNVMFDADSATLTGFIDLGTAGVADRYLDLALAARSITFNWGAEWVAPFFDAYGIAAPDARKIAFFKLLDELTWLA